MFIADLIKIVSEPLQNRRPWTHIISFIGRSQSGKTASIEALVQYFHHQMIPCAVVKHIHQEGVEFDTEGKNTWRFTQAGAEIVGGHTSSHSALFLNLPLTPEKMVSLLDTLGTVLFPERQSEGGSQIGPILLLEGYRSIPGPKILCVKNLAEFQDQMNNEIVLVTGSVFQTESDVARIRACSPVPLVNCLVNPQIFLKTFFSLI